MDISNIANLINAIAVTAGVIFAAVQIRQYQKRRQRDAMLELVRSFQSPAFTAALRRVLSLPDGADAAKIEKSSGRMAKMRFIWSRLPGRVSAFWFSAAR